MESIQKGQPIGISKPLTKADSPPGDGPAKLELSDSYDSLERKVLEGNYPRIGHFLKGAATAPAAALAIMGGMIAGAYVGLQAASLLLPGPLQLLGGVLMTGAGAFLGGGVLGGKISRRLLAAGPTPPYVSYDEKQQIDPREKELWKLRNQTLHRDGASIEEKVRAAGQIKSLSTELANDPDFVLHEYARDGDLRGEGLGKERITSKEAKKRLEAGDAVLVGYYVGGKKITREARSMDDVMHMNKLLESEYLGAAPLGLEAGEVEAFNILKKYNLVCKDNLQIMSGLHKPGAFNEVGAGLDIITAFERLGDGDKVVVLEERGAKPHTVQSFDELRAFYVEDIKRRYGKIADEAFIKSRLQDLVE
jgi:hypothetical protein